MHPTGRHMIVLLVWSALVVVAVAAGPPQLYPVVEVQHVERSSSRYQIHVANGLSGEICFASCKSKDTDIGGHYLDLGANFAWHFTPNFFGTTLFWCTVSKTSGDKASFDVWWGESRSSWLRDRCGGRDVLTCIWIAKDDGIYLRNLMENKDERIHKWNE